MQTQPLDQFMLEKSTSLMHSITSLWQPMMLQCWLSCFRSFLANHHWWLYHLLYPPMGWIESPPYLCSATKTAADLANCCMFLNYLPPHRLEAAASTKTSPPLAFPSDMPPLAPDHVMETAIISAPPAPSHSVTMTPLAHPLSYIDPYMDDFASLVQGNRCHQCMVHQILMHTIDKIFHSPTSTESVHHKEPISIKKL